MYRHTLKITLVFARIMMCAVCIYNVCSVQKVVNTDVLLAAVARNAQKPCKYWYI